MKKPSPSKSQHRPVSPQKTPRFGGIATFSRLPYIPDLKGENVDVAILGIPSDGGTTYRPGARFGPRGIRAASVLNRNYNPELQVEVYERLSVVDAGDVDVNVLNLKKNLDAIEARVNEIHSHDTQVISLGGDHSVLLGILRATSPKYGVPTLIQFDAHTDTAESTWGEQFPHSTPIRRAIEEKLIEGSRIFQIGIRGPLTAADQDDYIRDQKINTLTVADYHVPKVRDSFFQRIKKVAGKGPVYITFDIDGVDPAFAPGTGTPVVGGLTSFEALHCVRALKGLNLIGADIVEVAPVYDHAEITSLLASALVFEFLTLMAENK